MQTPAALNQPYVEKNVIEGAAEIKKLSDGLSKTESLLKDMATEIYSLKKALEEKNSSNADLEKRLLKTEDMLDRMRKNIDINTQDRTNNIDNMINGFEKEEKIKEEILFEVI